MSLSFSCFFVTIVHILFRVYKSFCVQYTCVCCAAITCCGAVRTLETVIHKMEESAQDITELQSQVGLKHSVMMTERELAADARDQTLKCMYYKTVLFSLVQSWVHICGVDWLYRPGLARRLHQPAITSLPLVVPYPSLTTDSFAR